MRIGGSSVGSTAAGGESAGVVLGRYREGDGVLPTRGGEAVWSFEELRQPALVLGASGKGKTETLLRVLYEVAAKSGTPVFYLDAKGDEETAERFVGLMESVGRHPRVFPNERFDGWRGDWRSMVNRLLQVVAYVETGPAAYYRDIAKTVLQTACGGFENPPRSSAELLDRLSMVSLAKAGRTAASSVLTEELVAQVRMRYEAFFGQLGTVLDGDWAWEDTDAAYLMLDSVGTDEDAASVAKYAFADFGHYFKHRKRREQKCVLAVDEFSAIASSSDVAMRVEQARGYNAFLLLAPQTVSGMGSIQQQSRILGSVDMLICHGTKEPQRVAELGGQRMVPVLTQLYEEGGVNGQGNVRLEPQLRLEAGRLRELGPGEVWLLRDNKAMKVAIERVSSMSSSLPPREEVDVPLEQPTLTEESARYMEIGKEVGDEK